VFPGNTEDQSLGSATSFIENISLQIRSGYFPSKSKVGKGLYWLVVAKLQANLPWIQEHGLLVEQFLDSGLWTPIVICLSLFKATVPVLTRRI